MKRVILFIPTLVTGGAEKLVVDMAVNMDRSMFDVSVAAVSGVNPVGSGQHTLHLVLKDNHIKTYDLKGKSKLGTFLNIHKLFREQRPDIVHANLGSILYVMFFTALYRTKGRIFTFHNVPSLTARGYKKKLYEFAFKVLKFIPVGICDYIKKTISEEYHLPPGRIPCIFNGVDTRVFFPRPRSRELGVIEFISTGTLNHIKNHKLLIDAFARTEKTHPDIRLKILGDGELREELEKQIASYDLEEKINIIGITRQVADFLNKADIYVMSSNLEGLPLSVLEAMACGLPVIATGAGGVVDIVETGRNGIVTKIGDADELSDAMINMIENEALRNTLGAASRRRALEYDIRNCVDRYQKLYLNGKLD